MPTLSESAALRDALSERLLRLGRAAAWRQAFLGGVPVPVRAQRRPLVVLCTDAPLHGWTHTELAHFAGRFGGWSDVVATGIALLAFDQPAPALRAALLLLRIGANSPMRTAVLASECTVGEAELDGETHRLLLPPAGFRSGAVLRRASPGSIFVSPQAYPALEDLLRGEVGSVLVTTERDGDAVAAASITLLPQPSAFAGTFAGLGAT